MKHSEIQVFEFPYFALLHTGYIATNTRHLPCAAPSTGSFGTSYGGLVVGRG
jgi:hypothetical protein